MLDDESVSESLLLSVQPEEFMVDVEAVCDSATGLRLMVGIPTTLTSE